MLAQSTGNQPIVSQPTTIHAYFSKQRVEMDLSAFTGLALVKCAAAAEVLVMKAYLHFVISEAFVAGEVTTRYWSTVDVPDLPVLDAAAAAAAGGTAEGVTPNEVMFAPAGGTVGRWYCRGSCPGSSVRWSSRRCFTNNGGGGGGGGLDEDLIR